jgi:hypothetical protein
LIIHPLTLGLIGDSGGFLLSPAKKLIGVVSEGPENDADLGKMPTIFVKLSYFREFLTPFLTSSSNTPGGNGGLGSSGTHRVVSINRLRITKTNRVYQKTIDMASINPGVNVKFDKQVLETENSSGERGSEKIERIYNYGQVIEHKTKRNLETGDVERETTVNGKTWVFPANGIPHEKKGESHPEENEHVDDEG